MQRYFNAAAVTGAVRQARGVAPALRRVVARRGPGVTAANALRRAVGDWRTGSLDGVTTIPSFTQIRRVSGGVVAITTNGFSSVAIALTWRPSTRTVHVNVRHKEIHQGG